MKLGIGCLMLLMMLGTALFSVQVFAQSESSDISTIATTQDTIADQAQDGTVATVDTTQSGTSAHSMDTSPENKGFTAVPWFPASFIRQTLNRISNLEKTEKSLRNHTDKPYPVDNNRTVTDRILRMSSNVYYFYQTHLLQVSKLTAG